MYDKMISWCQGRLQDSSSPGHSVARQQTVRPFEEQGVEEEMIMLTVLSVNFFSSGVIKVDIIKVSARRREGSDVFFSIVVLRNIISTPLHNLKLPEKIVLLE